MWLLSVYGIDVNIRISVSVFDSAGIQVNIERPLKLNTSITKLQQALDFWNLLSADILGAPAQRHQGSQEGGCD